MATSDVKLTINFRDGTCQALSHPASVENGSVTYDHLNKALNSLQDQSNAILTQVVEKEKAEGVAGNNVTTKTQNRNLSAGDGSSESDGEEDEDEDDDTNGNPPPEKRLKT